MRRISGSHLNIHFLNVIELKLVLTFDLKQRLSNQNTAALTQYNTQLLTAGAERMPS